MKIIKNKQKKAEKNHVLTWPTNTHSYYKYIKLRGSLANYMYAFAIMYTPIDMSLIQTREIQRICHVTILPLYNMDTWICNWADVRITQIFRQMSTYNILKFIYLLLLRFLFFFSKKKLSNNLPYNRRAFFPFILLVSTHTCSFASMVTITFN